MSRRSAVVTERTFYEAILQIIREKGGSGIQEVQYNSVPDVQFEFVDRKWLLSVKIGESATVIKSAFLQYLRHKEESGIQDGLLLILPEEFRRTPPVDAKVLNAIRTKAVTVLVDAGLVKEEYRDRPFPDVMDLIQLEVAPLLERQIPRHYSFKLVIALLRAQVLEVMSTLTLTEETILKVATDRKLISHLGSLDKRRSEEVTRFLAAYIILSQILFLRLFAAVNPSVITGHGPMNRRRLSHAFRKVLEINYRPIFEIDVLDVVEDKYLRDTFELIWGLAVERVRYELPGRIFHALMPPHIRKLLAAFYTRPHAAELLARLTIQESNVRVFDPASGSGTILVGAYKRKRQLHELEGRAGNPHKRYCEDEIFGADIMPFAAHLSSANLAATDVPERIERTLIIQGDSIELVPGKIYEGNVQLGLYKAPRMGKTTEGSEYEVPLSKVDVVLMNPPFTKVERKIKKYVNMHKFKPVAGGEVGLWGHYVFLANQFLATNGIYGAVLPINILRGRESAKVREFVFKHWRPLYIIKSTRNYGFSEWAEYRDILLIAENRVARMDESVKFCLIKEDLKNLTEPRIEELARAIREEDFLRSPALDIDSHMISDVWQRSENLMWFCGVTDLRHRDTLIRFLERSQSGLREFPDDYFHEGYRPVPKGVSHFMFVTRNLSAARVEKAFLRFDKESKAIIHAHSALGVDYEMERSAFLPSVRTPVGLNTMDITSTLDYVARSPYSELTRVLRAVGYKGKLKSSFWATVEKQLRGIRSNIVVSRRINPFSPNMHLVAFISEQEMASSNQMNIILETDLSRGRAVCTVLNSTLFLAHFFLLKEESTGRYIDIRFYDMYQMPLFPGPASIKPLNAVFERYKLSPFPALPLQFDQGFLKRYQEWVQANRKGSAQARLWTLPDKSVEPAPIRLQFDADVCGALGIKVSETELREVYEMIVREMILTKALIKD